MAKKNLDLKKVLKSLDSRNHDFYNNLSDAEKKEVSPFILMKFMSSYEGDRDIQEWFITTVNDLVNKDHWVLSKNHKELLCKLLASTGTGTSVFHPFLNSGKKEKLKKIDKLLIDQYPNAKLSDLETLTKIMTKEDRELFMKELGLDKTQRKMYE